MPDWNDENSSSYKIHNYRQKPAPDAADFDKRIKNYYENFAQFQKVDKNGNAIPEVLGTRPVYRVMVGGKPGFLRTIHNDPFHVEFSASNDPNDNSGFKSIPIFPGADDYSNKVAFINSHPNPAENGAHETYDLSKPSTIETAFTNLNNGIASQSLENRNKATELENGWRDYKVRDELYKSIESRLTQLGAGKFRAENDAIAQGKYLGGVKPNSDDLLFYGIVNDMIRLNQMGGYTGQGIKGTTITDAFGKLLPGASLGTGEFIPGGHINLDPKAVNAALQTLDINTIATADNIDRNRKLDLQNEGVNLENQTRSNQVQINPTVQAEVRQTLNEELDNNKNGNPLPKGTDVLGKDAKGNDNVRGFLSTMDQAQTNKAATGDINKPGQVIAQPETVKLDPRRNIMVDGNGNPVTYDENKKVWLTSSSQPQPPPEKGAEQPTITPKPTVTPGPASTPKSTVTPKQSDQKPPVKQAPNVPVNVSGAPTSDWNLTRNAPIASTSPEPKRQEPETSQTTTKTPINAPIGTTTSKAQTDIQQQQPAPADQDYGLIEKLIKGPMTHPSPAPLTPEPGTKPPKVNPWGILQPLFGQNDQLPSNAEMGAPLGSPDNPIVHQEHVDALAPGTPFHWRDHPDPYVKV